MAARLLVLRLQAHELKPGKLQRYELLGEPVLVGRRRDGQVYAIRDICPHRAAPLSAGRLVEKPGEGETIRSEERRVGKECW